MSVFVLKMKSIIKRELRKYYDFKVLRLVRRKQKKLLSNKSRIEKLNDNDNITSIIFSKDRAMQLNAFLSSYIALVHNYEKIYIIYKCSDDRHQKSYEDLITIYKNQPFIFIKEENFRNQLLNIITYDKAKSIIFYVDDMIFIKPFDYLELKTIDTSKYILSLTRGEDLTFSIVLNKPLKIPTFQKYSNNFVMFDWFEYGDFSDWEYPLGVSGYMFGRKECLLMLENIPFKAPNSLESNLQKFLPLFKNRKGVCPVKVLAVCVHANIIQTEISNRILGTFSIQELLDKWENFLEIDISDFYDKNAMVAQEWRYNFIKRVSPNIE